MIELNPAEIVKPFKPCAFYNKHGDQIECFIKNDEYYAKWLNPSVTVYLSMETDEVVGFVVENVKRLIREGEQDE